MKKINLTVVNTLKGIFKVLTVKVVTFKDKVVKNGGKHDW